MKLDRLFPALKMEEGTTSQECRQPPEAGKSRRRDFPLQPERECNAADTEILAGETHLHL